MMALARMGIEYPRRLSAEGRAEGLASSRELLRGLVTQKFGAGTAEQVSELLREVDGPARFAQIGSWIIDCETGEELLARIPGTGNGR